MILTIYLIGYILAYILMKISYNMLTSEQQTWNTIIVRLLTSIFSWIIVCILLGIWICEYIEDKWKERTKNSKPPKWL